MSAALMAEIGEFWLQSGFRCMQGVVLIACWSLLSATLNDVQYPRYRVAFKLRKLQKNFLRELADIHEYGPVHH